MDTIVYDAVQDVKAVAEYKWGGHRNPSKQRTTQFGECGQKCTEREREDKRQRIC